MAPPSAAQMALVPVPSISVPRPSPPARRSGRPPPRRRARRRIRHGDGGELISAPRCPRARSAPCSSTAPGRPRPRSGQDGDSRPRGHTQITYTIMHADGRKAMLPFDHPLYDSTPDFLRTVCTIEAKLHENLDLLCFTHKPPVTSQQLAANHAKVLLLLFEALVNYRVLVNPLIDADSRELGCDCSPAALLKELKKQYTMLLAEEYKMIDYLMGPCEKQTNMVHNSLQKLETDMRPLRVCDY